MQKAVELKSLTIYLSLHSDGTWTARCHELEAEHSSEPFARDALFSLGVDIDIEAKRQHWSTLPPRAAS
jgi:hypothetical protein